MNPDGTAIRQLCSRIRSGIGFADPLGDVFHIFGDQVYTSVRTGTIHHNEFERTCALPEYARERAFQTSAVIATNGYDREVYHNGSERVQIGIGPCNYASIVARSCG